MLALFALYALYVLPYPVKRCQLLPTAVSAAASAAAGASGQWLLASCGLHEMK